jgi:hypothetical protein
MRKVRWASWTVAVATMLLGAQLARADVTSDKAAAIVVWPIVNVGGPFADDTLIQLSNTSSVPAQAHCFYLNANKHCTNTGDVCAVGAQCCDGGGCGLCLPGWQETDFRVFITARQPVAWLASDGLQSFCTPNQTPGEACIPLDGTHRHGPVDPTDPSGQRLQSNIGTRIPPAPETPFVGELKCIAVDNSEIPLSGPSANVLKGEGTLEFASSRKLDVGKYNAIGLRAVDNPASDTTDNKLILGGDGAEYEGCPSVLVLNHFFDGAVDPVYENNYVYTWPVFVPCTEDLLKQVPGTAIAQYLVFNEFEQRFSTSNTIQCFSATALSNTDTFQAANSIFNAAVAGTLVGQTRISPIGSGLLAVSLEFHADETSGPLITTGRDSYQADSNVHYQGRRDPAFDTITLP